MFNPRQSIYLAVVFFLLFSCGTDDDNAHVNIGDTTTHEEKYDKQKFTEVPLTLLPSIDERNDDTFTTDEKYPYSISLVLDSFRDQVAVFGVAYKLWLGPKGWTGKGEISPEGNIHIRLHPAKDSTVASPSVSYIEIPSCQSCAFEAAAPYFATAQSEYKRRNDNKSSKSFPGMTLEQFSPSLALYRLPAQKGMATIGVVNYIAPDSATDAYYMEARFVLPAGQEGLADFFAKKFIEMRELR